jgi:hypothetical protein
MRRGWAGQGPPTSFKFEYAYLACTRQLDLSNGSAKSHIHAQYANICRSQQQVLHETCQEMPRIERKQAAQDIDYVTTIEDVRDTISELLLQCIGTYLRM